MQFRDIAERRRPFDDFVHNLQPVEQQEDGQNEMAQMSGMSHLP